jgi:hypothetical protein
MKKTTLRALNNEKKQDSICLGDIEAEIEWEQFSEDEDPGMYFQPSC